MTKEEYQDFALRYKGCGACFPMYHTLSRAEKMWFTAIQKDVAELEKEVELWKKASENNSYKAFQLQEENKTLSMHIVELQNDKGELTDKCREPETQIEKMKCCCNCKHFDKLYNRCEKTRLTMKSALCNSLDKWEIKEK